jgi:hypothetical protein
MVSLGFDGFAASSTDVLWFRLLYSGYIAALHVALVPMRKASCDETLSELGWRGGLGHGRP